MKTMKRLLIGLMSLTILALSAALLSACAAPKAVALDGADKDTVLAFSEPAADNLLAGFNAKDYPVFSRDFNAAMLTGIDEKGFADMLGKIMPKLGAYQSRTVTAVEAVGDYYRVTYRASFEQDANARVLITFDKADPHKVAGLFFTSDRLK
jgi:hypothetical protein